MNLLQMSCVMTWAQKKFSLQPQKKKAVFLNFFFKVNFLPQYIVHQPSHKNRSDKLFSNYVSNCYLLIAIDIIAWQKISQEVVNLFSKSATRVTAKTNEKCQKRQMWCFQLPQLCQIFVQQKLKP